MLFRSPQLSFATRMEDWTSLGQHKRHPEFPVVTRESRRNSGKTTWLPWPRDLLPPAHPGGGYWAPRLLPCEEQAAGFRQDPSCPGGWLPWAGDCVVPRGSMGQPGAAQVLTPKCSAGLGRQSAGRGRAQQSQRPPVRLGPKCLYASESWASFSSSIYQLFLFFF